MGVMHPCHYPGCMKKFDRKYNLKCHLRIHSNEKPYRCHHQNCTRSFRWKSSLNHHLMSLDHTPAAVRRARKARAQRRRIATTPPHTFVPQHSLSHQHPVFDLPSLSPVSSVATISHTPSPQQRSLPHLSLPQPHHLKLQQRLNPSHITASSITTNPLRGAQDLQFVNRNQFHDTQPTDSVPNQRHVYSHHPPSQDLRSGPSLNSQAVPAPKVIEHQHQIMPHLQDPLAMPIKSLHHPLMPDSAVRNEMRSYVESPASKNTSEAETSIHAPVDDTISLITSSKKSDPLDCNLSTKVPMASPLVSIFEELSPVSLMPFTASLDSLFPANMEGSA